MEIKLKQQEKYMRDMRDSQILDNFHQEMDLHES